MNESNTSERPARGRAKVLASRFLFGLASLATLVALAYAEENWRGRRAWQAHRREWEANGEKFAIADLIPPPVPDEKNFALAPLLKPLLDLTNGPAGVVWRDTNGMARLSAFSANLPPNRATNDHLDLGSLDKATFADLAAWREFYRGNTNYPQAAPGATPAEAVLTALDKFEPQLRELREAAATRPYSRFPVQYEAQPPWGVLLPHLARVKVIALALNVRATAELDAGRPTEAFEDLKLALRLSESIRDEPPVVCHLVRLVMLAGSLQTVREGLVRHVWTDSQLAELEASLGSLNLLAEYKAVMRGERAASVAELDYLRRYGDWGVDVTPFFGEGVTTCGRILNRAPSGWVYQNMLVFSRFFQDSTLPAVDERARRIFPDSSDSATRALQLRRGPYTLFVKLFYPGMEKVLQRAGRIQTYVDATRVACALERYRLANGQLPDSLTALMPRFIERIPNDVIDGQPLRWRRNADGGYLLYSVGWNKTDEGGALGWNQTNDNGVLGLLKETSGAWVDPAKGDWTFSL